MLFKRVRILSDRSARTTTQFGAQFQPDIVLEIMSLLQAAKTNISWHVILNNHSSTRPDSLGGKLFPSLRALKNFQWRDQEWRCELDMPCSFQQDDGLRLVVEATARKKDDAGEKACCKAFATLIAMDASKVVLRPTHWTRPVAELMA